MIDCAGTLAVVIPGCAEMRPDGVAMPSSIGPLIDHIAARVERVAVVAYDPPPSDVRSEDEVDYVARNRPNLSVTSLGPRGTWRDLLERRRRVRSIVAQASKDWDAALWRVPNRRLALAWAGNRCPRNIATIHGYAPAVARVLPDRWERWRRTLDAARTEATVRRVLVSSGVVIANSPMLIAAYAGPAPRARLRLLSMVGASDGYRTADRLDGERPRFMICSRITATKGVFEAVDAFAAISRALYPEARLDVIGDGDALGALNDRVASLGLTEKTTFHGWVPGGPDLFARLRDGDVLLHLSYAESFPCVVWEAMSHSVLVVSTDVGGLPGLLRDGTDVMFVPARNSTAPVEAVRRLSSDAALRMRMLASAYERSREATLDAFVDGLIGDMLSAWPELTTEPSRPSDA